MKNKKMMNVIVIFLSVCSAVLNAMPNAVLMRFADANGPIYEYFSGFSMLPVGYGIWGAMIAGVGSVVLAVLGIGAIMKESAKLKKWMLGIAAAALLMRLTLLIFCSMTFVGVLICLMLAAETVLLYYMKKNGI